MLGRNEGGKAKFSTYNRVTAVDKGLKASVWVYRCATLMAMTLAAVPWRAEQLVGGVWQHQPISQLQRLISRPNPQWTTNRLHQEVTYSLMLAGEAYISKIRSAKAGKSKLVEGAGLPHHLWVLPPDRLAPVVGGPHSNLIVGYENRTDKTRVPATEIMQPMFVDPSCPYHGLAPLVAAMKDVDTDVEAANWQKLSFENRAVPDGIFKISDYMYDDKWDETKKKLYETYVGSANAHLPMMLGQDVDWKGMAQNMIEADFKNLRLLNRENICAAMWTPPILVGILDRATYSNFSTSELWYWKSAVLPTLKLIQDIYNTQLAPEFGPDWRLIFDVADVDALLPLFAERMKVALDMVKQGAPWSIVDERLNLGLPGWEGWDVGLVSATLVNVADFADPDSLEDM
ncbi:MAG: phage portal protein [Rhodospirillaceae bacterium]|nr:phage portal protein [Rhodospirillaceae bacterium]